MTTANLSTRGEVNVPVQAKTWMQKLAMGLGLAAAGWLCAGLIASVVLAVQAPVSREDLHLSSWLGSKSLALHWTTGTMGTLTLMVVLISGLGMASAKSKVMPAVIALVVAAAGWIGLSEEAYVRMGVLQGTVRIGCFVPEMAECRQQLGLSGKGLPSRYEPLGSGTQAGRWSAWYREERAKVVGAELEARAKWQSMPGVPLLLAPLHVLDGGEIQQLMADQKAGTRKLREQAANGG